MIKPYQDMTDQST